VPWTSTTRRPNMMHLPAMKVLASLALTAFLCLQRSPSFTVAAASSPTYYEAVSEANSLLDSLAVTENYEKEEKLQQQQQKLLLQNTNTSPKQSYNQRRKIKGNTPKRRTLANRALHPDDEDLEQFLRYLQFSYSVSTSTVILCPTCSCRLVSSNMHWLWITWCSALIFSAPMNFVRNQPATTRIKVIKVIIKATKVTKE
jgi:hypothetical protein